MNRSPIFARGRILKLEMLESLRDFPRDIINIHLEGYSNGILKGCRLDTDDSHITISPGIIYFENHIYMLKEESSISYLNCENEVILKMKFRDENKDEDFLEYRCELVLDDNLIIATNEIELCRFKLKSGFRLRANYRDFEDMQTQYNTINIIESPFASYNEYTISPQILRFFADEAFQYHLSNPFDISFCMICLSGGSKISKELLVNYISSRLNLEQREFSNNQIYMHLNTILKSIKEGSEFKLDSLYSSEKIYID